jgi:hypothetical protein
VKLIEIEISERQLFVGLLVGISGACKILFFACCLLCIMNTQAKNLCLSGSVEVFQSDEAELIY